MINGISTQKKNLGLLLFLMLMTTTGAQLLTGSVALPVGDTWYLCSLQPTNRIAYVVTYTTVPTTSTTGFGTIVPFVKISPNLTASSTGLISAVLSRAELTKYVNGQFNEYIALYSCCCDVRVIVCAIGSDKPPMVTMDTYCLTVRNPNAFTSYANIEISFDRQVESTTSPSPTPTTSTSQSTSQSTSTTPPTIPTIVISAGRKKFEWNCTNVLLLGLGWIIWKSILLL